MRNPQKFAVELLQRLRSSVTVDWAVLESVHARLRVLVRTLLHRYKYPPDWQQQATETVLSRAAESSDAWGAALANVDPHLLDLTVNDCCELAPTTGNINLVPLPFSAD